MKLQEEWRIKKAYNNWAQTEETEAEQAGWSGLEDQTSRFEQFLKLEKIKPFKKASILDVGCGHAALLDFLQARNKTPLKYTGIDLLEEFTKTAKEKHPTATIITGNFLKYEFTEKYDFCIASGIFNVKVSDDPYKILFETLNKMLKLSRKAIAFNYLKTKEAGKFILTDRMQIHEDEKVIKWCKMRGSTQHISGYDPFDSTIIIEKTKNQP
ncbi:class I SAM-dependent methyltransferase [Candidatus Woesearchaeota archaeon]|nr:MAG: class I SAM-dependent methyltransferase [Candidatus Woesearchaeota archaeon]